MELRSDRIASSSTRAEPPELLSEGAKAAAPADTGLAKNDVPELELQTARVDGSGDFTAGAACSPRHPRHELDPDSPSERKRTSVEEAETEQGSVCQH